MENKLNIAQQLHSWTLNPESTISDTWYDWFCKDSSLQRKGNRLFKRLKGIAFSPRFDLTKTYTFFKNNCPLNGPLYDDFRICDLETGNVLYTVTPKSGHTGNAEVYGRENNFNEPLAEGTWADIKKFFTGEE